MKMLLVSLFYCSCMFAQQIVSSNPHSIFGFELGQSPKIPECTRYVYKQDHHDAKLHPAQPRWFYDLVQPVICIEPPDSAARYEEFPSDVLVHRGEPRSDHPDWAKIVFPAQTKPAFIDGDLSALMVDGTAEAFSFNTLPNDEAAWSALHEKFGEPDERKSRELQHGFGAHFTSTLAVWRRPGVLVTYCSGYCETTEHNDGQVLIESPLAESHFKKIRDMQAQKAKTPAF